MDDPSLGLVAGHTYRLQFMVHDGDQNKTGGDVGEGCTVVTIAPPLKVRVIPEVAHACPGATVQLCAEVDAANPGIPPYTYLWSTGETSRCITVTAPATGQSASYSVQATDSFKQQASASSTVYGQRCEIAIEKSATPNHVCAGQNADVTYSYVVGNTGDYFPAAGNLVDDNGTPGITSDDFTTSWGPLAPGASQTLTQKRTVSTSGQLINTARATGTTGAPGATVSVSAQDTTIVVASAARSASSRPPSPVTCAPARTRR